MPFYDLAREVANGAKHMKLRSKSHPDPHLGAVAPIADRDQLD